MTDDKTALTANSTIGAWLEHPAGAAIVRGIAEQAGMDEHALSVLRKVTLGRLIGMSANAPAGLADSLVAQANGGRVPSDDEATGLAWVERITPGRFDGSTVIVTGAASGIGRAVASRVAREGGRVIAVDISADRLAGLADELTGHDVVAVAGDITSEEGVAAIVAAAEGRVDALANVAGLSDDFAPLHEVSDAVLERVFAVNVFGVIRLTRAVLPLMIAAGRGSIVNIASEAALRGSSSGLVYTASKNAVVGITKSTAFMYEPHGIRSNSVAPGGTLTGMRPVNTSAFGQQRIDSQRADVPISVPEALAASITFLLSDDSVNINGAILPSDGGESVY
ncbi:SDR family NAD(P)-dependent oxidoreductase [Rathayibacter sp. SD072]|uniref:SDR family NAD(P)-dependent oxidoreductase n=1 Tax=Rathayibacter sp. SD072 TaxID=2781731 RepID=UPI001A9685AB|nr:SDR family NAD(P)-dependent oxidoreductase [Rathayibacter sp. SD072]MBO0982618.1 SDR family NAD(P)-dependent oxidoreductase [Rathayibacter sp. SD072]